jgi:hypothetical protein
MDEQLDNDLRNHIREVFENFEDTNADEGWLQLRKKFPEGQSSRRTIVWLWWGAAAMLFLFMGIGLGLWLTNAPVQPKKFSYKTIKHTQPANIAATKKQTDTVSKTTPVITGAFTKTQDNKVVIKKVPGSNFAKNSNLPQKIKQNVVSNQPATNNSAATPPDNTTKPAENVLAARTADSVKTGNHKISNQQLAVSAKADTPVTKPMITKPKPAAKSMASMFAEDNSTQKQKSEVNYKKLSFEVYAATYFNYAQGSSNQLNIGAGFTANIAITKNLKLVTGASIGQNSLSYANAVPIAAAASSYALKSPSGISTYTSAENIPTANFNSVGTLKDYDASLVGVDVPLNLKYEFNPQKSDTYILAGVSSGAFIDETYTYKYNYPASSGQSQAVNQTSNKSFDDFYFAKTLNVAFGVGYSLGKNRLILEPFLKYPLEGLGSQNLHFGAGGLNLKFNFQPTKK